MSAFTVASATELFPINQGGKKIITGELTGTASYDTGGSVCNLSSYMNTLDSLMVMTQGAVDYECQYVDDSGAPATAKIFAHAAGTEVASEANLSGVTFDFIAVGSD